MMRNTLASDLFDDKILLLILSVNLAEFVLYLQLFVQLFSTGCWLLLVCFTLDFIDIVWKMMKNNWSVFLIIT